MKLTIRYIQSNGAGATVTLQSVQTITQTGVNVYAITCFGNDAVTWRNVTALDVSVDTLPAATPKPTKPVAPDVLGVLYDGSGTVKPTRPPKVNLCYKCQLPFTFRRSGSLLERIDVATGKPHECQGRAASAIVLDPK